MSESCEESKSKYFLVYLSSAGAGKTYTLTREYIKLALRERRSFSRIVAITFTNKATEEMRARILSQLHILGREQLSKEAHKLASELSAELNLSLSQLRERAREALQQILYDYGQFSVSTIDVFFQRLIRAFMLEVGLPGYYRIELDVAPALQTTAKQLLERTGLDTLLTDWLTRFVEERIQEGKKWNIETELVDFGRQIFREDFLSLRPLEAKESDLSQSQLSEQLKHTQQEQKAYEHYLSEQATKAYELLHCYELSVEDLKSKQRGPFSIFYKIKEKRNYAADELLSKTVLDTVEASNYLSYWITKSSDKKEQIEVCVEEGLQMCLEKSYTFLKEKGRFYASLCEIRTNIHLLGLVSHIQQYLRDYRDSQGIVFLSDVNDILRQLTSESYLPYLYEKVGSFYRHYLLDEFQDTSLFQFESLRPLLKNGVDEGDEQLVVGDRKQAIYRWRGASPTQLFEKLALSIPKYAFSERYLKKNWRSRHTIVEINNVLFSYAAKHVNQLLTKESLREQSTSSESEEPVAASLSEAYKEVEQSAAIQERDGYFRCTALSQSGENSAEVRSKCLDWLCKQVDEVLSRGYLPEQICVLVRRRKEGQEVVEALLRQAEKHVAGDKEKTSYGVHSQESLLLSRSISVQLLYTALQLLVEEEKEHLEEKTKSVAKREEKALWMQMYALWISLQEETKPTHKSYESFWEKLHKGQAPRPIQYLLLERKKLKKQPLYMLCEQLVSIFDLQSYAEEQPFLHDFLSFVFNYHHTQRQLLSSFLSHWAQVSEKTSLSSASRHQAIQVMTVHKAKGLEFPVVLLPFCMWSFGHSSLHTNYLWSRSPKQGFFSTFPLLLLRYNKRLLQTEFGDIYEKEKEEAFTDSLNLLYVACTRPKCELHICYVVKEKFFHSPSSSESLRQVGELLHLMLFSKDSLLLPELRRRFGKEEGRSVCEYGEPLTIKSEKVEKRSTEIALLPVQTNWSKYILVGSPEKEQEEAKEAREIGIYLHAQIAQIDHIDQLPARLAALSDSQKDQLVKKRLEEIFALPELQEWFSGKWQLLHEQSILLSEGNYFRPDLVLLSEEEAKVIDFKSSPGRAVEYAQKMTDYVRKVHAICKRPTSGFLVYSYPAGVVRVV